MAYGYIHKFYTEHTQFKLMMYLNRRGARPEQLAALRWDDVPFHGKILGVEVDDEMRRELTQIKFRAKYNVVPFEFVFYKKMPTKRDRAGTPFTPYEVWETCGKPRRKIAQKRRKIVLTIPLGWHTIGIGNKSRTLQIENQTN